MKRTTRIVISTVTIIIVVVVLLATLYKPTTLKAVEHTLHLGITKYEFKLMNPFVQPLYDANFFGFTHVPLVIYTPDLNITPCLAKSWEIGLDGKSIIFHLVENATWHDGKPVTAEDAAFSFEYWKKHKLRCQGYWYSKYLDRAEVIDRYTVKIIFKEAVAVYALQTYIPTTFIIPKHVWKKVEDPMKYSGKDAMIGCGPFMFEKYDVEAGVVYFRRYPNYFAGMPSIDKIEWRYYRTLELLLLALKKGEIDAKFEYYNPVPGVYVASLVDDENIRLGVVPDIGVLLHLVFGYRQYPMSIREFREAISYAINYKTLIEMIAAGYGEVPSQGYTPPTAPFYNPNLPKLKYDPEKAKKILDRAGFIDRDGDGFREAPDGSKLRIPIYPYVKQEYTIRAAEIIESQLRKIGLDVYVEVLSKEVIGKKVWIDRDYYMVVGYATPFGVLAAPAGAAYYADMPGFYGTCNDSELINLVKITLHAKSLEEMREYAYKVQEYVAREKPIIALIHGYAIYPYRIDKWGGWVLMDGYGPCNYWTWFKLKPKTSG